ncbi:hypothetical protein C8F01DRAFT_1379893 [Mycena amicta]|nr:hypothetical protein C8F01DRAFT_1379893 [Mycena amicta]
MSAPSLPPQLPPFDAGPTIGAFLVGTLCSYILYGITNTQMYLYFGRFADDPIGLKLLACVVWLFETAHVVCIGHALYTYSVIDYGNPFSLLGKIPVPLALSIILSAIITAIVQGFFAFRIWTLAPNKFFKIIPILLWISAFVYLLASLADTSLVIKAVNIPAFIKEFGWLLLVPWVINLVNDNTITISLVVLLLMSRKRGFDNTTALVDKLITWTIETGMITSIFSILNLALYQQNPNNFIWVGIQFVKARLFANSLLASLNSRQALRDMNTKDSRNNSGSSGSSGLPPSRGGRSPGFSATDTTSTSLNIAMTKVTLKDNGDVDVDGDGDGNLGARRYGYKA